MASIHISCAICDDSLDNVVVEGGGVAVGGPFRDGGCPVRATTGSSVWGHEHVISGFFVGGQHPYKSSRAVSPSRNPFVVLEVIGVEIIVKRNFMSVLQKL
jgi:hypothetical protein